MEKLISKYKKILPDKNSIYYTAYITWLSISLLFGRSTLKTFLGISTSFWLKKVCYPICGVLILIVFSVSGFMEKPNKKQLKQYFFMGIWNKLDIVGFGNFFYATYVYHCCEGNKSAEASAHYHCLPDDNSAYYYLSCNGRSNRKYKLYV